MNRTLSSYRALQWLLPLVILAVFRLPVLDKIKQVRNSIETASDEECRVSKTGVNVRSLSELKLDLEKLASKKQSIQHSLFDTENRDDFAKLILLEGEKRGVAISKILPGDIVEKEGYSTLSLYVEITGDFINLLSFIRNVEQINRIIKIDGLSLTKEDNGRILGRMNLSTYVYKIQNSSSKNGNNSDYLSKLNKALSLRDQNKQTTSGVGVSSPFVKEANAFRRSKSAEDALSQQKECHLKLKGILWKTPPLAVIENIDGQTYVVEEGRIIDKYTVQEIKRYSVLLSSPEGKVTLRQYDDFKE
jgi:Tfp pilus assembly protein PilO